MAYARLVVRQEHDETRTTKRANKIERRLTIALTQIYNGVKTDSSISSGVGINFGTIRSVWEVPARDAIRAAVTEIYIEASRYVTVLSARVSFFLTETDILIIKQLSTEFEGYFWSGLEHEFVKKLATAFDPRTLLSMRNIPLKDTFVARMTESLSARVMAEATLSKTAQIAERQIQAQTFRSAQTEEEDEDEVAPFLFVGQAALFAIIALGRKPRIVFVTARDERVCPICAPLHGKQYDYDDPDIPKPVVHTHLRCRCRLMLVDSASHVIMK